MLISFTTRLTMLKPSTYRVKIATLIRQRCYFISLLGLLTIAPGCVSINSSPIELSLQATPTNRPGLYTVSGETNLPEGTPIVVQGIRYVNPAAKSDQTNYSVLARQVVKVSQGKWQATLNLWQITPDGRYQEAWQQTQPRMRVDLRPSSEVIFSAMTEPVDQVQALEQTLQKQGKTLKEDMVRSTPDGQWYLEAKESLIVKLPDGQTAPGLSPDPITEEFTAGGVPAQQSSAVTVANSAQPSIKQSQTTAPLSAAERFR